MQSLQTALGSRICLFLPAFYRWAEQEVLWRSAAKAGVHIELYGGMDGAERCMGRFGDPEEFGYEEPFPICAVKIEPLAEKFAENFSHRVLGRV